MDSKPSKADEPIEDTHVENEYLAERQRQNEQLKSAFEERKKIILELQQEKELKDCKLATLQSLIEKKVEEIEKEARLKEEEFLNENNWMKKLKDAKIRRFASALAHQEKMAELRQQLFSPMDLDESRINNEIEYLKLSYEEMTKHIKFLQYEINHMEKKLYPDTEVNDIIDNMDSLIKHLSLETDEDREMNRKIELEITSLEQKILKNTERH